MKEILTNTKAFMGLLAVLIAAVITLFVLQGSAAPPQDRIRYNDYNASYMDSINYDTYVDEEKMDKMNNRLNKFMHKHPGGQVQMSTSRYATTVQYSYNK